jgi:DNA polymerase-1
VKTPIVIDIETDGGNPWDGELLTLSWCGRRLEQGTPLHEHGASMDVPSEVVRWLKDPDTPNVAMTKYDWRWLRMTGYEINGPLYDVAKMAHTLNENTPLGLAYLANYYCDIKMDKRLSRSGNKVWFTRDDGVKVEIHEAPWDQLSAYCMRDTETTLILFEKLWQELDRRMLLTYYLEEEVPFTRVLLDMEVAGMPIDLNEAAALKTDLTQKKEKLESEMEELLGYYVSLSSPKQLQSVLYEKVWAEQVKVPKADAYPEGFELVSEKTKYAYGVYYRKGFGLKPLKKKNDQGKWVVTTESPALVVNYNDIPWVNKLLEWRKYSKVISTYLETYPDHSWNGRIYATFDQSGTVTHRLSSREPNLQNQPAHGPLGTAIRSLFKGQLIVGDHSQLEPRLMAHFSGDPVLLDIYRTGKDIYLTVAEYIFGRKVEKHEDERQLCKTLILGLGYLAQAKKVSELLTVNGFPTKEDKGQEYLDHLHSLFGTYFEYTDHEIALSKVKGYVKTIGGHYRRLNYAYGDATWKVKNKAERQAVNARIQGSAADILRRNMVDCIDLPIQLLAQVHDELVFQHQKEQESWILYDLENICINPGYKLDVPLKFEPAFCNTWAEKGGKPVILETDA